MTSALAQARRNARSTWFVKLRHEQVLFVAMMIAAILAFSLGGPCAGDVCGAGMDHPDGAVDINDIDYCLGNWGGQNEAADTNADGVVNVQDLIIQLRNWGVCQSGQNVVTWTWASASDLDALGVRTIISVDAVPPDRRCAEQLGISLIHIPLNYSGPNKHQIVDLTTAYAMARGDGKVYVHCHHGVHRAPTACALISIAIGISTPEQAQAKMAIAGTSDHYPMLWTSVDMQTPIDMLDVVSNIHILPSAVTPSDIASSMTMIDEAIMRLERIRDYGWSIPPDHPDLAPASDAGLIAETLRTLPSSPQWGTFGLALSDAEAAVHAAAALEQLLLLDSSNATALNMKLNLVRQSCTQCHGNLRNNLGSAGQRLVIVE